MKIVILDAGAANPGDLSWEIFEQIGEVIAYDYTPQDKLIERAIDADICLTNKTCFTAEIIENLPKLKYIGVLATGYNVVDLKAASLHNIVVTNVPEYATFATAQMSIALLLELTNLVGLHNTSVKNGDWTNSTQFSYHLQPLSEIYNKNIVIIGTGKIGSTVANTLHSLGGNITGICHDINKSYGDFKFPITTLEKARLKELRNADIISLHCPLNDSTKNLINTDLINNLKDGVMIINTARGPVVNEKDMANALINGKVKGYAADVVSIEPILPDNPLLNTPNCYLTPHIAWAPLETRKRLLEIAFNNLQGFVDGKIINQVN